MPSETLPVDADATVHHAPEVFANKVARYHRDADCPYASDDPTQLTTSAAKTADADGFRPCSYCVGRLCPECEERITGKFGDHLLAHAKERDDAE